jgi:SAM-dependent methyltransferase
MNLDKIKFLRCPKTKRPLEISSNDQVIVEGRLQSGILIEPISKNEYPVIKFIPRFVDLENYANSFGLEWNKHSQTQVDEFTGLDISKDRFFNETKWGYDLKDSKLLEVGSGSGRFTCHALTTGADVFSIDFSNAVEANYKNNGHHPNLLIVQASVYELPFEEDYFDKVLCIGVLQHTPNPRLSFKRLVESLKPGGSLVTDIYLKSFFQVYLTPKYLFRIFTKHMNPDVLYKNIENYINAVWPVAKVISKIPYLGPRINWRLLIADYRQFFKISDDKILKEMAILDTFDMLSPRYDLPATKRTFLNWHKDEKLLNIDIHYGYNGIEARAQKKL